ncbi:ADP-ribose pyrophosphatase YjhB, NUDIX family [Paenibacillus tianmuensis]|uniref:ADP-ribose pyrophosphatase YjhB, NUDIX family n=1 Tax=Paenibacillus tianmuensis TaxID=624147 RepID=A0A1G4R1R0_9BACL|nr:NUDIX domain-containing protein [Paenibacillus tianmuensis]SCW50601.1 ADP-ribose pyrophosphatase YjhB, NUDIX family [Paenibacillus tianmuensis]
MPAKTIIRAGLVIFDDAGKVLLVRHADGKRKWGLPGGRQREGEAAWETAIRECQEEIQVVMHPADFTLSGIYYLSGRNAYVFDFKVTEWEGTPVPDGKEIAEVGFFLVDKLPAPISKFTAQRIQDAARNQGEVLLRKQQVKSELNTANRAVYRLSETDM